MSNQTSRPLNRRALAAMTIVVSGLGLPVTGLILHALHGGHGGARHAWMSAHWSLGIIFIVGVIWHLLFNRKVLLKYLHGMTGRLAPLSRELVWALTGVSIIMLLVMSHALFAP